jgi:hypothetical protein
VNDPREALRALRAGVRAVTTDVPQQLLEALAKRQAYPATVSTWDELFGQAALARW